MAPTPPSRHTEQAVTLVELLVSMSASIIILTALILSVMSLQHALNQSATYAGAYSDQRRLTDYLSRDLRRAVDISYTDAAGVDCDVSADGATVEIADLATLTLTLPPYYKSNATADADYQTALQVVGDAETLDYGLEDDVSDPVTVTFRKCYNAAANCVCFVREEAGQQAVIVRAAENLTVVVTVISDPLRCTIETAYRATGVGWTPTVSTYDQVLLRNTRLDYQP